MRQVWRAAMAAGLVGVVAVGTARSQLPGAGPAAGGGIPGAAVGAGPVAAPAAAEKVGFIKRICIGLDECRRKLCRTPAGQLLNGMTKPITFATGGVIPPFCPLMPSEKDLAQPGVAGAAAAAQKEALEAKARRDAVRFLGTLDCRYFPDAAVQLATALRTDSSECVRYEAALVLGRGCCCTELTIKALTASVSGTEMDGAPAERSVRVRCAAAAALERCLSCYVAPPKEEEEQKSNGGEVKPKTEVGGPEAPKTMPDNTTGAKSAPLTPGQRMPSPATVERAMKTLNEFNALLEAYHQTQAAQPIGRDPNRQSVYHFIMDSGVSPASHQAPATAPMTNPMPVKNPNPAPAMTPSNVPAPGPMSTAGLKAPAAIDPPMTMEPVRASTPMMFPVAVAPAPMPVGPTPVVPNGPAGFSPTAKPPVANPPAATTPVMTAPPPAAPVAPTAVKPAAVKPAAVKPAAATTDPVATEVQSWAKQALQGSTAADRHAAIRQLVKYDWRQQPMVAAALLAGAKSDPVDVVRVDCLRHLAAYKVAHPQVLAELAPLANDADPWVRQEAAAALSQLKGQ